MSEEQLQQFLRKVEALRAFVALSEADPLLREQLRCCGSHHEVVALARSCGLEIGRRWGEQESAAAGGENLLGGACPAPGQESVQVLLAQPGWRLERIHSCAASSPQAGWFDQSEHEWVLLLQGTARLKFADEARPRDLSRGDVLQIAPHRLHRVLMTDPAPGTVWLALFWSGSDAA